MKAGAVRENGAGTASIPRRAALGLGGAGTLGLLLAGCGRSTRLEAGTALVAPPGERPLGVTAVGPWTNPLAPPADEVMELPGVQYSLHASGLVTSLPALHARAIGLPVPEDDGLEDVLPASGETFLLAVVRIGRPRHLPDQELLADGVERVLLDGVELARSEDRPLAEARGSDVQILVSVPEGVTPERIVLETVADGITQTLSLLDGTRMSSDIEHVYAPRPEVEVADNWWQHRSEAPRTLLAGTLLAGDVTAVAPDGTWAAPDSILVSLCVSGLAQQHSQDSSLELLLPDGTSVSRHGDHSRLFEIAEGGGVAWFEVPADLERATARLEIGLDGTTLGTEEIEVTFTRG